MKHFIHTPKQIILCQILFALLLLNSKSINGQTPLSGAKTIGTSGDNYITITAALSDISSNGIDGPITLLLQSDYNPASETFPISFSSITGSSITNTITIMPDAGVSGINLSGNNATAIIDINGGDFYILDGRPGGIGSTSQLTIDNTELAAAIRIINDASNNIIRYCNITGVNASQTSGVIKISTSTETTGNDNNTIDYCNIHAGTSTPCNAIYAKGTSGKTNDYITISNCNIYDFFNNTFNHCGILIEDYNTSWTISNNSFFETAQREMTASSPAPEWSAICLNHTSITNTSISNNYIGGKSAGCGGTAMQIIGTGAIRAVKVHKCSDLSPCSIQGNIFKNISFTSSSNSDVNSMIAIQTGSANIGSTSGNTIGDENYPISFTYTGGANDGIFSGIFLSGYGTPGSINISNNTITKLNVNNTGTGNIIFRGISLSDEPSSLTVSQNTIYDLTNSDDDNASNTYITGIFSNTGTNNTIQKNKIYKLNGSSGIPSYIYGIHSEITANTIGIYNNMITLDGGTKDHIINGIAVNNTVGAIALINYNSVYVNGTIGVSSSNYSSCFNRITTGCRVDLINNILFNSRTGTTTNFCLKTNSTSLGLLNSNYNLFVNNAEDQMVYETSSKTLSDWKTQSYDLSSWMALKSASSSNTEINPDDFFNGPTSGDLSIKSSNQASWFVNGKGIAGASSNNISTDFSGDARLISTGKGTDIGADEFTTSTTPHTITLGAWALNTPQIFSFGGRNLAVLEFKTGTPPTSMTLNYYSGENAADDRFSSLNGKSISNAWWSISPTGGTGYTYDITLVYDDALIGTLSSESDINIGKWAAPYNSNYWQTFTATLNTSSNTAKITGQNTFSKFILADKDSPLPVELTSFFATMSKSFNIDLTWTTSSETNNEKFEIERSLNAIDFNLVGEIGGQGTKNSLSQYKFTDQLATDLENKTIYYRLKQIDYDGNFQYSNTIQLNPSNKESAFQIESIIKNGNQILISVSNSNHKNVKVILTNSNGQIVYSNDAETSQDHTQLIINTGNLMSGIYNIVILNGEKSVARKIML